MSKLGFQELISPYVYFFSEAQCRKVTISLLCSSKLPFFCSELISNIVEDSTVPGNSRQQSCCERRTGWAAVEPRAPVAGQAPARGGKETEGEVEPTSLFS